MLAFIGVARKTRILPASGPLSTVAISEICPRELLSLAMLAYRLVLAGKSVLRSVITPFCQIKPWDELKVEYKVLPTTCPLLLLPVANAAKSPGSASQIGDCPVLPERGIKS